MKTSLKISVLAAFMLSGAPVFSQSDSLGMPGDNLDLTAVLSIFKQASNMEDFEKKLNSADTKVNNLDLNGDGQVDYLRVVDYGKDDFHSIVIQDPVSKTESQDVAVIEIVKKGDNTAHVQIVGDESLYGKDYIIEPEDQAPLNNSDARTNTSSNDDVYASQNASSGNSRVMINVWAWPAVSYIYSPGYSYWVSPWYWGYYPMWYSPWRPYGWYYYHRGFYGYNYGFYGYRRYHPAFTHVHNYYYGRRVTSSYVQKTAPNYNRRVNSGYNGNRPQGGRSGNQAIRSNGPVNPNGGAQRNDRVRNGQAGGRSTNRGEGPRQTNVQTGRSQNASPASNRESRVNQGSRNQNGANTNRGGGGRSTQMNPGNSAPSGGNNGARMGGNTGGARMGGNPGGGSRSGGNPGGGARMGGSPGGGGGARMGGGGHGGGGGGGRR